MKIKVAKIEITRISLSRPTRTTVTEFHTLEYFKECFDYTLETGRSYNNERGAKKVSPIESIESFKSLISNLDKAESNLCRDYQDTYYSIVEEGYIDSKELSDLGDLDEESEEFQNLVKVSE